MDINIIHKVTFELLECFSTKKTWMAIGNELRRHTSHVRYGIQRTKSDNAYMCITNKSLNLIKYTVCFLNSLYFFLSESVWNCRIWSKIPISIPHIAYIKTFIMVLKKKNRIIRTCILLTNHITDKKHCFFFHCYFFSIRESWELQNMKQDATILI